MQGKTPAVRQIVLVNFLFFIRFVSPLGLKGNSACLLLSTLLNVMFVSTAFSRVFCAS